MGMYERYAEHTLKTNGKTKVEQINDVFYSHTPNLGHPFLIEKKLYDIDLPSSKMRALDFIENYDDPDIKRRLEASIKLGLYNKHAMFKKDRCEEKKAICIHFPAGWENAPNTSANTNRSAVNYYVHRDGTILELGEPELWDHHSSCGSRNKNIIAIEIVNVGPLKREGNCLFFEGSNYCDIDNSLEGHGKAYIDLENNPYDPKGIYPEGSYRGYRYYAAWTTDQMRSLKKLLKALCAAYDIPYKFLPPEYRFKYFPSLGYVTPTAPEMQKYCYQDSIITYADGFKWLGACRV